MKGHSWFHAMALFAVIVWGTTFVSTKVLLNTGLTPAEIMLYRFLVAYVMLFPFTCKQLWARSIKDELMFVGLGITGGSLYFVTENIALDYTLASNVSILLSAAPIFTAILSRIFLKDERLKRSLLWGSFVALAGVAMVVFNGRFVLKIEPVGDLLTLTAALSWGFYTVILKKLDRHYDILFITRKVFFYGLMTLLPVFYYTPLNLNVPLLLTPVVLGNLLFLGIIASFVCFILWNKAVKELGGVRASNYIYLGPLVTLITAAILLHEQITAIAIFGAILIVGGVYFAERGIPLKIKGWFKNKKK